MSKLRLWWVGWVCVVGSSLPACSESGSPPDEVPGVGAAGGGTAGSPAGDVGFQSTVLPLVSETCNCHQSEPILMAPFSLKVGEAYDNLVNAPSTQVAGMRLVTPGSLNDSYLWHKLNGTHLEVGGSGARMPSNIPLNTDQIEVFGRWIAAGAPP